MNGEATATGADGMSGEVDVELARASPRNAFLLDSPYVKCVFGRNGYKRAMRRLTST